MTLPDGTPGVFASRAERLLEQALEEVRDGLDPIPTVSAALTALRIEVGELNADMMDGYQLFDGKRDCTCPPDLLKRGGFRGRCPSHGTIQN